MVEQTGFGGSEFLLVSERDEPMLDRPRAVRIAVSAAGVSRWDLNRRRGLFGGGHPPFVPGYQGCGVVEAVGPLVEDLRPGDRVWWTAPDALGQNGACAEYRVVEAEQLLPLPDGIDDFTAAAAPLALVAAMQTVADVLRNGRPRRVLVHDAATDVGYVLLQMAELATLRMAALVRNEEQQALLFDSGADRVELDDSLGGTSAIEDWSEGVGCDVLICCGDPARAVDWLNLIATGGRVVVCAPGEPVGAWRTVLDRGLSVAVANPLLATLSAREQRRQALREGGELLAQTRIELPVTRIFPLEEAVEAFEYLDAEAVSGGVILDINA